MTPYARTKQALEAEGFITWRTEVWNQWSHRRIDLFNAFDLIALKSGEPGVLGLQPTSGEHVADHIAKLLANPMVALWLQTGNRAQVWGWRKVGPRGKRKLWECRRVPLTIDMMKVDTPLQTRV